LCQRLMGSNNVTPSMPSVTTSADSIVNLLHFKLFYHFETWTTQTLLLTPDIWGYAIQLSFQYDFLMNSILCISARHLAALLPEDRTYSTTAASHLCRALERFRHELSTNFMSIHIDAFIATSILLQFEIWTNTDSIQDGKFDPSRECFFSFSSSLKQMFLKCIPLILHQPSVFLPHLQQNSEPQLVETAQLSDSTLIKYQNFFSLERPLNIDMLLLPPYIQMTDGTTTWESSHSEIEGYASIINYMCLILSFIEREDDTHTQLLPQLASYIATFPVLCRGLFASMVQESEPHALLLLYHFYRSVRILLPSDTFWWARKRATLFETVLKEWLTTNISIRPSCLNDDCDT
jgi:hypothetical protein